jgi:hypothetical protein
MQSAAETTFAQKSCRLWAFGYSAERPTIAIGS